MPARTAFIALAVLGCISICHAALTTPDIVSNINTLSGKSQSLQSPASGINILDGALFAVGQGKIITVIAGLRDILDVANSFVKAFQGTAPISNPSDADRIADAFKTFARLHQTLLDILTGKAGLFTTAPFVGPPMAAILRQVEGVLDTMTFDLIDNLKGSASSAAEQIKTNAGSLLKALDSAITSYSNLKVETSRKL